VCVFFCLIDELGTGHTSSSSFSERIVGCGSFLGGGGVGQLYVSGGGVLVSLKVLCVFIVLFGSISCGSGCVF